jgi:hypothetical protein
MEQLLATQN